MKASDLLVKALEREGVECIFVGSIGRLDAVPIQHAINGRPSFAELSDRWAVKLPAS